MAFPTVSATNSSITTGDPASPHTINLPASISSGDLLIIVFHLWAETANVTTPSGWTLLTSDLTTAGTDHNLYIYYKVASGSEGSTLNISFTANFSGGTDRRSASVTARITGYSGVPQAVTTTGSDSTPDPASLTPTGGSKDWLWIATTAYGTGRTLSTYPTSYSSNQINKNNGSINSLAFATRNNTASSENPGTFTLSGTSDWITATIAVAPVSSVNSTLTAAQGSYAYTGQTALLKIGRRIIAALGSYTLTGFAALLAKGKILIASVGSFTYTGYNAAITSIRTMIADLGTYGLTGQNTLFSIGHRIIASVGNFTLTGINAVLSFGRKITAAYGSFTLTGQSATFRIARLLTAAYGSITISWQAFRLLLNGLLAIYGDKYTKRDTSYSDKYSTRNTNYTDKYTHL